MKKEKFKVEKVLPEGVFAHHVFHIYAPAVVQNLLPMSISVEAEVFPGSGLPTINNYQIINNFLL